MLITGVVVLKLIAYDDRPDQRQKDIEDIDSICKHYPSIEQGYIWEKHNDLCVMMKEKNDDVAMIVLGREIKALINKPKVERTNNWNIE
ncbi:MAG: hypothetical protein R2879_00610 [Saprospiraceae bacterium]